MYLWLTASGFSLLMAVLEWIRFLRPASPMPYLFSAVAVSVALLSAYRIARLVRHGRNLRLALEGEKVVGQQLETLRELGYKVIHDVVGDGFNIDHVIIGPGGVFTVETKSRRKPARGRAEILFDGQSVSVNGGSPSREPVIQAEAQARWIGRLLTEYTGKTWPVQPVVVFPGWYVVNGGTGNVWVLNENAFCTYVKRARKRLSTEDTHTGCEVLATVVRLGGGRKSSSAADSQSAHEVRHRRP